MPIFQYYRDIVSGVAPFHIYVIIAKTSPHNWPLVNFSDKHVTIHLLTITFPFLSIGESHSNITM